MGDKTRYANFGKNILNGLKVIDTPKHNFKNIAEARTWAKKNIVSTYHNENTNEDISVSGKAIYKYLSEKAVKKSVNLDVHLSTLKQIPLLLKTALLKERSADKDNNPEIKEIQRLYGTINYDNQQHPVKITVKVVKNEGGPDYNKAYSYEVIEIENPTLRQGFDKNPLGLNDLLTPTLNPDVSLVVELHPSPESHSSVVEKRPTDTLYDKDTNISEKNKGNDDFRINNT